MATDPRFRKACRKIGACAPITLNFDEVRYLGLRFCQSWERDIEMAVDKFTGHNVGLSTQFFTDACGPNKGYLGALQCMEGYVGDARWPHLTQEALLKLNGDVAKVLKRIKDFGDVKEATVDGVDYHRCFGVWFHTGSGKEVLPVKADGSPMTADHFKTFLELLDAVAEPAEEQGVVS